MTKEQEIADLKRRLNLPAVPEDIKANIRAKIASLEGTSEKSKEEKIADLKKKIASPSISQAARDLLQKKLDDLEDKGASKPKEKPAVKKPMVKKPVAKKEPKVKFVKKKVATKEKEPIPMEIKPAPKKRGRKPLPKKEEVSKEPKVVKKRGRKPKKQETPATKTRVKKVFKPTTKVAEGEPDCDTLLKQFRDRRAKAKTSQKKRKTTPVFRKIASDVVDAVEKAIKNVPAKQIKESPKVVIRKFGNLQKAADSFLKAFRDVLGSDYQKSQAEIEINDLKQLIQKLIKKYSQK